MENSSHGKNLPMHEGNLTKFFQHWFLSLGPALENSSHGKNFSMQLKLEVISLNFSSKLQKIRHPELFSMTLWNENFREIIFFTYESWCSTISRNIFCKFSVNEIIPSKMKKWIIFLQIEEQKLRGNWKEDLKIPENFVKMSWVSKTVKSFLLSALTFTNGTTNDEK